MQLEAIAILNHISVAPFGWGCLLMRHKRNARLAQMLVDFIQMLMVAGFDEAKYIDGGGVRAAKDAVVGELLNRSAACGQH